MLLITKKHHISDFFYDPTLHTPKALSALLFAETGTFASQGDVLLAFNEDDYDAFRGEVSVNEDKKNEPQNYATRIFAFVNNEWVEALPQTT